MSQFIVIAYDSKDADAYERRLKARPAHIAAIGKLRAEGKVLLGIAITDDGGKMIGSVVVADFPSRAELNAWLAQEPYVVGKVWDDITVLKGAIGPGFQDLIVRKSA